PPTRGAAATATRSPRSTSASAGGSDAALAGLGCTTMVVTPLTPSALAAIRTVPGFSACTCPSVTVAIDGSSLDQKTLTPEIGLDSWSRTMASSWTLSSTMTTAGLGLTSTAATPIEVVSAGESQAAAI